MSRKESTAEVFDCELLFRPVEFEWDTAKSSGNLVKHGVDFAEAMTVFGDPFEITVGDPDHSEDKSRS